MKKEYPLLRIRTTLQKREAGQASFVLGLFLLLFLAILLCMQLQLAMYRESSMYMEDALALSNLASAVIDVEEYGISGKVLITDPERAYERYCHALKENLGLDDSFTARNHKLISGRVEIQNYTIFNINGNRAEVWQRDNSGRVQIWTEDADAVRAPNGQKIEETGVYSEITYPIEGFLGTEVTAHKGKLVDVISENNKENENEIAQIQ